MNIAEEKIRKKIIDTAKNLGLKKLNHGKAGNISVRWKDGLLITPSGISYDKIKPKDIVFIDKNKSYHGIKKPSIETPFHFDIIKNKKDVNCVVHTHAKFAIPGSQELSNYAVKALKNRKACLLANHGVIITGKDIDEAAFLAEELETLCKQITIAKINGTAKLVGKRDMKKIIEAVKTYGKQ